LSFFKLIKSLCSQIYYFEKAIKSNNISFNKYSKSIFIGNKSGNLAIIELPKSNDKKIKINVQFKENNKIFKGFNSLKNDKFKLIYSKYSRD